jgi:CheY-like chemotaxis protein
MCIFSRRVEAGNEIRIVVAEDSQAGQELWSQLEQDLSEMLAPKSLSVTFAQNAGELLGLLGSLERTGRRPDMVLIDLHVPVRSKTLSSAASGNDWPDTAKVGVWISKRIRATGNDSTLLVLWTSNVLANELNDAYAFCNLTVDGRPIGDYVIDKATDRVSQAEILAQLLKSDRTTRPVWMPPEPTITVTSAPRKSLPYLELGLRSQAIASELVLSKKTIDDHKAILRDCLCGEVSGDERELSVAIVSAARRAYIPWIPLYYADNSNDPLNELGRGS